MIFLYDAVIHFERAFPLELEIADGIERTRKVALLFQFTADFHCLPLYTNQFNTCFDFLFHKVFVIGFPVPRHDLYACLFQMSHPLCDSTVIIP